MRQLGGIEVVVFYGIAWAIGLCLAQSRYLSQGVELHFHRHTRGKSVEIHLCGVLSLGFEKERMLVFIGEGDEFCFDGRAVARTCALNLSVEKG